MDRKEFNRELMGYIRERRRKGRAPFFLRQKPKKAVAIKGRKGVIRGIIGRIIGASRAKDVEAYKGQEPVETKEYHNEEFEKEEKAYKKEVEKTGKGLWSRVLSLFGGEEKMAEGELSAREAKEEKEQFREELKRFEKEEEKLDMAERGIEEKKVGLIYRFLSKFRLSGKSAEEEVIKEEAREFDLSQDLKEMAKITTAIIKMLPYEELQRLKRSPEFFRFKEILEKNKLVKAKAEEMPEATAKVQVVDMPEKEEQKTLSPSGIKEGEINIYRLGR